MKNRVSTKVIAAVSSFLFAVASFAASTYAWFAFSGQLGVENFEFSMSSGGNFYIGLKANTESVAKHYGIGVGDIYYPSKGVITNDMFIEFGQYASNDILNSVTSAYDDEWLATCNRETDAPILNKVPTLLDVEGKTQVDERERWSYYYQLEIFFKSDRPMDFYLSPKTFVKPNLAKNKESAKENNILESDLNKICSSLRVSFFSESSYFIYEPNPDFDAEGNIIPTRQFGKLDLHPHDGYYDNAGGKEVLFGKYSNKDEVVYHESGKEYYGDDYRCENGLKANTQPNIMPVDLGKSIENGIDGKFQKTYSFDQITADGKNEQFRICRSGGPGEYENNKEVQRLIVTIWVEGWDYDSIAYSSKAHFDMNLDFKGKSLFE